jgi:hypothetical protein
MIQFPIISFDYFQPSPAKKFIGLTEHPGVLGGQVNIFDELKPIHPDELMGEWDGYILTTGHPFEDELETLNWFGNTFDSTDDVAPLIVARNGKRVCFEDWGACIGEYRVAQGMQGSTWDLGVRNILYPFILTLAVT